MDRKLQKNKIYDQYKAILSIGFLIFACIFSLSYSVHAAAAEKTIGFQGQLFDAGEAVTGNINATFQFYDAETSGNTVGSSFSKTVTASNGYFSTTFTESDLSGITFNQALWIEVTIDGTTLSPRSAINSVPYAHKAFGVFSNTSAPTVGAAGALYYNTTSNKLFASDGVSWSAIGLSTSTFSLSQNALLLGSSTGFATELAAGTANQILAINASGTPAWTSSPTFSSFTSENGAIINDDGNSGVALTLNGFGGSGKALLVNGKIHIGDSSAVNQLDVSGSSGVSISNSTSYSRASIGAGILVVQNKIGIGTTTPGSALSVVGDIQLTGALSVAGNTGSTGQLLQSTGTGLQWVATSSLGITSGGGSGTVNSGTMGQVAFYGANGTTVSGTSSLMLWGNKVGVGIASPLGLFQVEGGSIYANAPQTDTVINGGAGTDWQTNANLVGSAGLWAIRTGTDASINFDTNNTFSPITALSIKTNGNIGIGTTTPSSKLVVAGDINLTGALKINGSAGSAGQILQSTGTGVQWVSTSTIAASVTDHNSLSNLTTGDAHTQYALLAGRSGGQTLIGGTASGNNLTLQSTSNATRGKIYFGSSLSTYYDEANNYFSSIGIGVSPSAPLHITGTQAWTTTGFYKGLRLEGANAVELGGGTASPWGIGASSSAMYFFNSNGEASTSTVNYLAALTSSGLAVGPGAQSNSLSASVSLHSKNGAVFGTTSKFQIQPDFTGNGDLPAGSFMGGAGTNGSMSFAPSADVGTAGAKTVLGYYNGSTWKSAVEFANTSGSSNSVLMLMKGGGNVGIGTSTPSVNLVITSSGSDTITRSHNSSSSGRATLQVLNNGSAAMEFASNGTSYSGTLFNQSRAGKLELISNGDTMIGTNSSNFLLFGTNGSERMRITSTGLIGIGTSTPVATFTVQGSSTLPTTPLLDIASSSNSSVFRIVASGNVGIGSTTPGARLSINSTGISGPILVIASSTTSVFSVAQDGAITINNGNTFAGGTINFGDTSKSISYNGSDYMVTGGAFYTAASPIIAQAGSTVLGLGAKYNAGTGLVYFGASNSATPDAIISNNAGTELFRATYAGNFGIGTTTPGSKLSVVGDLNLTGALKISGASGTAGQLLQSTGTGLQWVATSSLGITGGAGSGTVNSGTIGQVAFYDANGTAVSGTSTILITGNNVGIGTSPGHKFHVSSSATATWLSRFVNGTAETYLAHGSGYGAYIDPGSNASASTYALNVTRASLSYFYVQGDGKVGIGTTTPAVKLSVVGTAGNNDIFTVASSTGTNAFIVKSTGNVGIGTTTPGSNLTVYNAGNGVSISANSGGSGFALNREASTGNIFNTAQSAYQFTQQGNGFEIQEYSGAGSFIGRTILSNGNFGVVGTDSTTSSGNKLWVKGNAAIGTNYKTNTAPTNGMLVEGSVGIGTSSPTQKLAVVDTNPLVALFQNTTSGSYTNLRLNTDNSSSAYFQFNSNSTTRSGTIAGVSLAGMSILETGGGPEVLYTSTNNQPIIFMQTTGGSAVERARFSSSGYLGIGTTTPSIALVVAGNAQFTGVTSGTYGADLNITAEGILTTSASDRRLKENLMPLASTTLSNLLSLKTYSFSWINDPEHKTDYGLIAQEVAEVMPGITFTNPNDGYMGINYSRLIPMLIRGVQEQQVQIDQIGKYATILKTKEVHTEKMCLGDDTEEVCIDRDQLKILLDQTNQSPTIISPTPSQNEVDSGSATEAEADDKAGSSSEEVNTPSENNIEVVGNNTDQSDPASDTGSTDTGSTGSGDTTASSE